MNVRADKWDEVIKTAQRAQRTIYIMEEKVKTMPAPIRATSWSARGVRFVFFNNKKAAARYVKHSEFYAKKSNRYFVKDNIIDLVGYPIVDNLVGRGMRNLNQMDCVQMVTKNISADNREFLAENIQLVTSSGIVKLIQIESDKGIGNANSADAKNFAKSCAAQVGCDVVDEYLIKPTVETVIGDVNHSWSGWAARGIGNYILAGYVIDRVSKL